LSDDLNWRVEAACLNAWPSSRQIFLDGWSLRASGGSTRRANSANPLHAGAEANDALIEKVEAFYRAQGRPAIFRITDMANEIDRLLEARGYVVDAPTRTLYAALGDVEALPPSGLHVESRASAAWLDARDRLNDSTPEASHSCRDIISAILLPCAFVSVVEQGQIVSLAFGVLQDDLLIVESVITDQACRQRGLARLCVVGVLGWAREQGASAVALQVMAENDAAIALYRGLGISRDLYGYHYRVRR